MQVQLVFFFYTTLFHQHLTSKTFFSNKKYTYTNEKQKTFVNKALQMSN